MLKHFEDKDRGGFFFTADDHEQLIARNKDLHDASVPSGNAMAATALLQLGKLTGKTEYLDSAARALTAARNVIEKMPTAAGQMLIALDFYLGPASELVLIGGSNEQANQEAIAALQKSFLPRSVIAYRNPAAASKSPRSSALDSLFTDRESSKAEPTLYICQNFTCQSPITGAEAITNAINDL
jgi:uncharacterized protein YyaL (SSP411 family)